MKTLLIALTLILAGCAVSMEKPQNRTPQQISVKQDLHACYMEAQTPH